MKRTKRTNTKRKRTAKDNDIAMAYRIDALPGRVPKFIFLQTLIDFLNGEISELPKGWKVTWLWRNSAKSKVRYDTFQRTIANSREGFMTLMLRRLRRDLEKVRVFEIGKPKHRKRAKAKKARKSNRRKVSKVRTRNTARKSRKRKSKARM